LQSHRISGYGWRAAATAAKVALDETRSCSWTVVDIQILVRQILATDDDPFIGSAIASILAGEKARMVVAQDAASTISALCIAATDLRLPNHHDRRRGQML
jgi:hypothetical protein